MSSCDLTYCKLLTDLPTVGYGFDLIMNEAAISILVCLSWTYILLAPHFHQYLAMLVLLLAILPGGRVATCDFNLQSLVTGDLTQIAYVLLGHACDSLVICAHLFPIDSTSPHYFRCIF